MEIERICKEDDDDDEEEEEINRKKCKLLRTLERVTLSEIISRGTEI